MRMAGWAGARLWRAHGTDRMWVLAAAAGTPDTLRVQVTRPRVSARSPQLLLCAGWWGTHRGAARGKAGERLDFLASAAAGWSIWFVGHEHKTVLCQQDDVPTGGEGPQGSDGRGQHTRSM